MDTFSCALLVCGFLTLLWCLAALALFPAADADMALVWQIAGDCPELEFRVRAYLWLSRAGVFRSRLLLADCGLTQDALRRAEMLARDYPLVELTDQAALAACWNGTDVHERNRTRDPARRRADGDVSKPR